jgi:putative DNA primase/helicase
LQNTQYINEAAPTVCSTRPFIGLSELLVSYSQFACRTDTIPEEVTESFGSLADRCREPSIRDEKDGLAFCPAIFVPSARKSANAQKCHFLAFDLDNLPVDVGAGDVLDCIAGCSAFTYSTYSHKLAGKGARFRVVVAVHAPIPATEYKHVAMVFAAKFQKLTGTVDPAGFSPAQMHYFPSCSSDQYEKFEFDVQQGKPYDWSAVVSSAYADSQQRGGAAVYQSFVHSQKEDISGTSIYEGSRNTHLFRLGAAMRGQGLDENDIAAELLLKNQQLCLPPLSKDETLKIAESVCRYPQGNVSSVMGPNTSVIPRDDAVTVTELSLVNEVMQAHSGRFHFLIESGKWIVCDPETNIWHDDDSSQVMRWFIEGIKSRREYAAELISSGNYEYGQRVVSAVKKAEKNAFIRGAQSLLSSLDGVSAHKYEFDANPYVVAFSNGLCADLKTLAIRKIEPTDKLSKHCGAEYHPEAICPQWERSILEWCCGDTELVKFLQVWTGYCLSGLTEQQCFLFLFGGGRNGKSVFISILNALMNDYAITMNPDSLMLKSGGSGVNNDIARLAGARLVTSVEMQEGRVFDENLIKQLTGGDTITARYLYKENFEFRANLKLMVTGNHKPIVKGSDFGFWRRFNMVPFFASVDKPDPTLTNKLRGEMSGILNWALAGWQIYQQKGLPIPEVIKRESNEYKNEMDFVGQWMKECTTASPGEEIRGTVLFQSFKRWAEDNGFFLLNSAALGRKLTSAGVRSRRDAKGMIYLDLRVCG